MRGAGCTYNDIVDRKIDALRWPARAGGRFRPALSASTPRGYFWPCNAPSDLLVLLQLNVFATLLGASSLVLVAIYPFMKRITWWPQAWLG